MRSLAEARFGSAHVLPSASREKAMVSAGDQLRFISERDLIGRLDARPLVEHTCARETTVCAAPDCSIDLVAHLEIGEPSRPSVCHQDPRVARYAVPTRMAASAVRIYRP